MATKTVYRLLYVMIFLLVVITCIFLLSDMKAQYIDPSARSDERRERREERREPKREERREERKKEKVGGSKVVMDDSCYTSESYKQMVSAVDFVKRYIDSFTQDSPREAFHPKIEYLLEAETDLDDAYSYCDWSLCSDLCVNQTVFKAILHLKRNRPHEASSLLDSVLERTRSKAQSSKVKVYLGFVFEFMGRLYDGGYQYYKEAVDEYPEHDNRYFSVIRYDLPDDAPREEKMKIYYYGRQEELIALVDGLMCKEFHPQNLESYPILRFDESKRFWYPENEKQYKLIRQLMSPFIQAVNAKMMDDLINNGHLEFKDPQAVRYYAYNERFSRFFQYSTVEVIRHILGRPVIASYTYFGGYVGGSTLDPHRDRPACEYTMSLCIDHYPHGSAWKLGINKVSKQISPSDPGGGGVIPPPENIVYADLQPGDAFIFQGRHKVHWRDGALPDGHISRVYFFHYVNEDYRGSLT